MPLLLFYIGNFLNFNSSWMIDMFSYFLIPSFITMCANNYLFFKKKMSPLQILDKITLDTLEYNGVLFGNDLSSYIFIQLTKFLKLLAYCSQVLLAYLRSRIWNRLLNIHISLRYKQIAALIFLASYFVNYISEIFVENVSITLFRVNRMIVDILYPIFIIKTVVLLSFTKNNCLGVLHPCLHQGIPLNRPPPKVQAQLPPDLQLYLFLAWLKTDKPIFFLYHSLRHFRTNYGKFF